MNWRDQEGAGLPPWNAPAEVTRESVRRVLIMMGTDKIHPMMGVVWAEQMPAPIADPQLSLVWDLLLRATDRLANDTYLFSKTDYRAWAAMLTVDA